MGNNLFALTISYKNDDIGGVSIYGEITQLTHIINLISNLQCNPLIELTITKVEDTVDNG